MKKVKSIILRTAGTNCDLETAFAFKSAGWDVELLHINEVIKKKSVLNKFHILAIPGGFTYGDDVASGKILANEIKFSLKSQISKFRCVVNDQMLSNLMQFQKNWVGNTCSPAGWTIFIFC